MSDSKPSDGGAAPVIASEVIPPSVPADIDHEVYEAVEAARGRVNLAPQDAATWGDLAMTLAAHEFMHEAGICFAQAAALAPKDPKWPYLHARSMLLTHPVDAVPLLERGVSLCGNTPAAVRLTLAELYLELHRLDDAEQHILAYEVANSSNPRARIAKARLAFMREEYPAALRELQQLTKYLGRLPAYRNRAQPVYQLMSEALRRTGDSAGAEQARIRALREKTPSWPDPFQALVRERKTGLKRYLVNADMMFGRKEYDQSIALLKQAIAAYPDSVWARILLGRALIRTGAPDSQRDDRAERLEQAIGVLNEALKLEPNSVEALFRLAVVKGYQEKYEESSELYHRAIKQKPDFAMAHYNLAQCRRHLHDIDGAIKALRGVVGSEPENLNGHLQLADLLLRQGKTDRAMPHLETAEKLSPQDPVVRRLLAQARQQSSAE